MNGPLPYYEARLAFQFLQKRANVFESYWDLGWPLQRLTLIGMSYESKKNAHI